jgi:Uma2 family endonuclease
VRKFEIAAPEVAEGRELFRLDTDRYHRMIDAGILRDGDKVELLNGLLVRKMSFGSAHVLATNKLVKWFIRIMPDSVEVRGQSPIDVGTSEPEPDVALAVAPEIRGSEHPTAGQVFLVVEIAESSLKTDRGEKLAIYARAGLPEYWIVNIAEKQVEVYTEPDRGISTYATTTIYQTTDAVPVIVNGVAYDSLPVADLFSC